MIAVTDHAEGCVLAVRAQPGARRAGVQGEQAGALKVAVTAPPEDGRANKALTDLLRDVLGVTNLQKQLPHGFDKIGPAMRAIYRERTGDELFATARKYDARYVIATIADATTASKKDSAIGCTNAPSCPVIKRIGSATSAAIRVAYPRELRSAARPSMPA